MEAEEGLVTMQAVLSRGEGVELDTIPKPDAGPDRLLVRTVAAGINPTDRNYV